jgi:hypothetical protein
MKKPSFKNRQRFILTAKIRSRRRARRALSKLQRQISYDQAVLERRRFAADNDLMFIRDIGRIPIILPPIMSLSDAYDDTVACINLMRQTVLVNKEPIALHFEKVERIDPSAALLLVAEIYRCRHLRQSARGRSVEGTYPRNSEVESQLEEMGFFKLLNVVSRDLGEQHDKRSKPIFLNFITGIQVQSEAIHKFVEVIEKYNIITLNDPARRKLVGALIEAMSNANEHAYKLPTPIQSMSNRWWLSASINPQRNEVTVILCDQGVGIPNTIDLRLFEGLKLQLQSYEWFQVLYAKRSDGVVIKAATELFRTGTGQEGRGKGFRDMKAFVDRCHEGELTVLSNRGKYHYIGGTSSEVVSRESFDDSVGSIGGTVIEWRIRNSDLVVMEDD